MAQSLKSAKDSRGNYGTPSSYRGHSPHLATRKKAKSGPKP